MAQWDSNVQTKVVEARVQHRAQSVVRRNGMVSLNPGGNEPIPEYQDEARRVRMLDTLIHQTGQGCGGWDATDHAAFVAVLRHLGWTDVTLANHLKHHDEGFDALQVEAVVRRCCSGSGVLTSKSPDAIRTHLDWYFSHLKLVHEKRRAIATWKDKRDEQRRASSLAPSPPTQQPMLASDKMDERRARELADTKAQVRAWRTERRMQEQQANETRSNRPLSSSAEALRRLETKQKVALYKLKKEEERARQEAASEIVRKASMARQPSKKQLHIMSETAIATAKARLDKIQSHQAASQQAAALPHRPKLHLNMPTDSTAAQPTKSSTARETTPDEVQDMAAARRALGAHAAYVPGLAGARHVKGKSFGHVSSQPRQVPSWRAIK
ncbi:hypothetical protein H310_14613 [Aphanomyces invadans]|uniref:Uncharacterized protein n=1 Tax=Aphanomyces invadans TaxID=157072 RepID=A0A024TAL5_9STRA|nr:hypothetical protein H310_14613 [Aphanomyces invadans]ETV90661.1 hypothetical protein H310_14613 [Aphanomyces invadans]|eukprot:XP_008880731.1 hypothetical protein H310_14613 [Aphanomyces invadans]